MTEAQLRAFVVVAETRGFKEAAKRLDMSQPGVSRAVAALEAELGGELLHRRNGTALPTALGERVLARARRVLVETTAMRSELVDDFAPIAGRVRLGSMPSLSATLPDFLHRLARRHPALEVTVIDGHDDELVQWAREGVVDVAVVAGEPGGLELQHLVVDELLAVVPATHGLAQGRSVARRALADHPFVLTRAGCEALVLAALAEAGVTPSVEFEVSEASAILAIVAEGLGVSVMPRLATHGASDAVALRPLRPRAERRLSLAAHASRPRTPAVAAFLAEADRWRPGCGATGRRATRP